MARTHSVAVGGYFPTPAHLIPRIACLMAPYTGNQYVSYMDPCAGDGAAILALMTATNKSDRKELYACEMEKSRYEQLRKNCEKFSYALTKNALHTDAFRVTYKQEKNGGISLLFLNPPYDFDRVHGRLEQKFLVRFTGALAIGGVLLFVVPGYALTASAEYLATEYDQVRCFKFPDEDYAAFKQVVLFAVKTETRPHANPKIVKLVNGYAANSETLPELPNLLSKPLAQFVETDHWQGALSEWAARSTDIVALLKSAKPWMQSSRHGTLAAVKGILPSEPLPDLLYRKYPVAVPPRPAHIAAGIASGIFNGAHMAPDDPESGLPEILVKGVFTQEYRTVEEKTDKSGKITSTVQVQQPRLSVTALNLATHKYRTLGDDASTDADFDTLTVAGLLKHYSRSLMEVMERQCPITYDPRRDADTITLAHTTRQLYTAQQHTVKALVTLYGGQAAKARDRKYKSAILLGEIGSGKTGCALTTGATIGSKRPLVVCPPHLLSTWTEEVKSVVPGAQVKILESISDIEAVAADRSENMVVSVLSRETAKLGHGWGSVGDTCPKCGALTPNEDIAKKRSRCKARPLIASGGLSVSALTLAQKLARFVPDDQTVKALLPGRIGKVILERRKGDVFTGFDPNTFDATYEALRSEAFQGSLMRKFLVWSLVASGCDPDRVASWATWFLNRTTYEEQDFGKSLLYLLPKDHPHQRELSQHETVRKCGYYGYGYSDSFQRNVNSLWDGLGAYLKIEGFPLDATPEGVLTVMKHEVNSIDSATRALEALTLLAAIRRGKECGEVLYHAIPEPRRIALAKHIQRHHKKAFDFLILDEAHEFSNENSGQSISAHRLSGLGMPTLLMTGSIMNGYASSLFINMWNVSPDFRAEFKRSEKQRFIDRYGYRKRLVKEAAEDLPANVVAFGSVSDRVQKSERVIGEAPGVLPLFLLRHLLPISVTLHKADLALELPECKQERCLVQPDPELLSRYKVMVAALVERIKKDKFDEELSGKLFGQLAEIPSYLDRSTRDTGNQQNGSYEVRYPESCGGDLVIGQEPFDPSRVSPKEQWMLDRVQSELNEGRNVMVFGWHISLLPRLAKLIEERTGDKTAILYADKVTPAKRKDWITKNVIKKGIRILVVNPVAVQTGLNNLVHFNTEIWMENPACNPVTYRQAGGRIDRIGAKKETRILFPVYHDTLQEQLHELLMRKVAVSTATDGLDPESALLASGVGPDEYVMGMSIGKQLWAMLSGDSEASYT